MRTPLKRSLILGSALIATLTLGGAATAGATFGQTDRAATSTATTTDNGPVVETEKGIVLEGFGEAGGLEAHVTVYENSLHGNQLQVVIGDPDDDLFGSRNRSKAFVVDGQLQASVGIAGHPAVLNGTVVENGKPVEIRDSLQDAGMRIVTKGSNTPLLVDATLTYRGRTYQLSFDPAFAYDLTVKKVTLYRR